MSQHSAASTSEVNPTPMNTPRQPVACATAESGAPARTEPRLPISMQTPTMVANRFSSNQTAMSLSIAMKVTDTPNPISVRPTSASSSVGAMPKRKLPAPPTNPPSARIRRGPSVSARMPVGICMTV